jgi:RNA polymerase sigma-70 factor, ECF subfamily
VSQQEARIRAACEASAWSSAATSIVELYGRELLEFLVATARSETDGADAFSHFTEQMWRSLPQFRHEASVRTWCYALARRSLARVLREPHRKPNRVISLGDAPEVAELADRVRTETIRYLRTEVKDRVRALRDQLTPDDQALLILRVDRKLEWREVAIALADEDGLDVVEVGRRAAALRKRFERIKDDLKRQAGA